MSHNAYWGGDRAQRIHPRLTAELLLDSIEQFAAPARMYKYLKDAGYNPSFVRSKGYVGASGTEAVLILPFVADNLESVAGLSINRRLDTEDADVDASATIVNLANGVTATDFTVLTTEDGKIQRMGPASFDQLRTEGVREVATSLAPGGSKALKTTGLPRVSKGRAIAAAALEDMATEERDVGFISESELQTVLQDTEFYADIARVHSYLASTSEAKAAAGCKYCTSTSSYACTSSSCLIFSAERMPIDARLATRG